MSAYASLPGSFLPPFFSFGSPAPITEDSSGEQDDATMPDSETSGIKPASSKAECSESTAQSSSKIAASSSCPALSSSKDIDSSAFKALSISSVSSFPKIAESLEDVPEINNNNSPEPVAPPPSSSSSSSASEIIIAIKSASVDPVQLVKCLTSRGSNIARRTASFIARTPDSADGEKNDAQSLGKGTEDANQIITRSSSNSSIKPSLCYEDSDSEEEEDEEMSFYDYDDDFSNSYEEEETQQSSSYNEHGDNHHANNDLHNQKPESDKGDASSSAIQFELSINFQGRKYTATRAFSTFVKLRNDLLRELNLYGVEELDGTIGGQKRNRYRRRTWEPCRSASLESLKCEEHEHEAEAKPNEFIFRIEDLAQFQDAKDKEHVVGPVSIPELPRVSPEDCAGNGSSGSSAWSGVACRGFSYLQGVAKLYCPEMEKWLRHVVDAVPSSPSLSRFLWEPLASSSASWDAVDDTNQTCDKEGLGGAPFKSSSAFAKTPMQQQRKSRTSKFLSKNSLGSLNSIHEAEDDIFDED